VTAVFGGTYQREGLAPRDRQLATLAALTALGGVEPQVDDHIRNSLRIGLEPREIVELMVHLTPYVGVPRVLAGLRVVAESCAAPRRRSGRRYGNSGHDGRAVA